MARTTAPSLWLPGFEPDAVETSSDPTEVAHGAQVVAEAIAGQAAEGPEHIASPARTSWPGNARAAASASAARSSASKATAPSS